MAVADLLSDATKPTSLITKPAESYGWQEFWAGLIVVGVFALLVWFRRYTAARAAGLGGRAALGFSFGSGKNKKTVAGYRGLLVGTDNRTSTSKVTAALWTIVVAYFLVAMALVLGFDYGDYQKLIGDTSPLYLIFLGGPFAAAVIAKSVVSGAVSSGEQQRSTADSPSVADVFSNDDGNTDLVDLQYTLFNFVVVGIVLAQFVNAPNFGAPAVPSFLAGLTSVSAATYVANKGLTTANPPTIDRLLPASVRPGGRTTVLGSNLIAPGENSTPTVIVGATEAPGDPTSVARNTPPTPSSVAFEVPPDAAPGRVRIVVRTPAGAEANTDKLAAADALTVVRDALAVASASPTTAPAGGIFTLYGSGFYNAVDVDADGNPIEGAEGLPAAPAVVTLQKQDVANPGGHTGDPVPCEASGTDSKIAVTVPPGILAAGAEAAWFDLRVQRGALPQVTPAIAIYVTP